MSLNKLLTRVFLTTLLALSLAAAPAFGDGDSDSDSDASIVGSWETASIIDPDDDEVPGFFSFNAEGTWVSTASSVSLSTAHGAWEQTGDHTFTAVSKGFIFGSDGNVSLLITNRGDLEVSSDGDSFTTDFVSEISLLDGTVIDTVTGSATGTRITVD